MHAVRNDGRSLTDALAAGPELADPRDAALRRELASGTLRLLPRLEVILAQMLRQTPRGQDRIVESLLLVGLYQLTSLRTPEHAAVSATVAAARGLGRGRLGGLVNAVLRRFLREREALLARAETDPSARWLLPPWLLRRLQAVWPDDWQAIAEASATRAPMVLRVNRLRADRDAYRTRLAEQGIGAEPLPSQPAALRLAAPMPAASLPGWAEGLISVQDAGAQWAATLLDPGPEDDILDACAAPGNKAAHLLEHAGAGARLTAIDNDPDRLATLRAAFERLGLTARIAQGDAAAPDGDWARQRYRRILLDAPCSATGVLRRHPDIKCLRREADIGALARLQGRMLEALWPLLEPGGRLLYVTCSLLPDENHERIAAFLAAHQEARELPLPAQPGVPRPHGRQLLPVADGPDGFFFALLERCG